MINETLVKVPFWTANYSWRLSIPDIKETIFNPPRTILNWTDGTKTIAVCSDSDIFDERIGVAVAMRKKMLTVRELDALIEEAYRVSPKAQVSPDDENVSAGEIPDGWRVLGDDEVIKKGDRYFDTSCKHWRDVNASIGLSVREYREVQEWDDGSKVNVIRKITERTLEPDEIVQVGDVLHFEDGDTYTFIYNDIGIGRSVKWRLENSITYDATHITRKL